MCIILYYIIILYAARTDIDSFNNFLNAIFLSCLVLQWYLSLFLLLYYI